MHCTSCGSELPEGAGFCSGCGAQVVTPKPGEKKSSALTGCLGCFGAVVVVGVLLRIIGSLSDNSKGQPHQKTAEQNGFTLGIPVAQQTRAAPGQAERCP